MQKKINLKIVDSDSVDIKKLKTDINNINLYHQNGIRFMQHHNLKEVLFETVENTLHDKLKFGLVVIKVDEENLPIQAFYGTVFLIKNNSIFEFTSSYTIYHTYTGLVTVHNLDMSDVSGFKDASNLFYNMDELKSTKLSKTLNFMIALIKNEFKLYIK